MTAKKEGHLESNSQYFLLSVGSLSWDSPPTGTLPRPGSLISGFLSCRNLPNRASTEGKAGKLVRVALGVLECQARGGQWVVISHGAVKLVPVL